MSPESILILINIVGLAFGAGKLWQSVSSLHKSSRDLYHSNSKQHDEIKQELSKVCKDVNQHDKDIARLKDKVGIL